MKRLDKALQDSLELAIRSIDWSQYLDYGSVKLQVRNAKVTVVTVEQTVKLD